MPPAGGSVVPKPGGLHLMLFEPVHVPRQGDSVTLVLYRSDGIRITRPVPVQAGPGEEHRNHPY